MLCQVTTVSGISRVYIVWSMDAKVVRMVNVTTSISMGNLLVYTDSYNISMLNTSYNARVIECEVEIDANPPIMNFDCFTLNVDGEYFMCNIHNNLLTDLILCTVPDPTLTVLPPGPVQGAMVGSPLSANCIVNTVDGVELDDVMISWTGPGVSTDRFIMGQIISNGNNIFSRSLDLDYLLKSDENNPYFCVVMILEAGATRSFELESLTSEDVIT